MNKFGRIAGLIMLTSLISFYGFAQKSKKDAFPTYEQIRGNKAETVDYVSPGGGSWTVVKRETIISPFDYPEGTAIYYLNGKRAKSKKRAEKEMDDKCGNLESVSIGPVEANGKRIIRIDYEPKKD